MSFRHLQIVVLSLILVGAVLAGTSNALEPNHSVTKTALNNVRGFATGSEATGISYAIDAGELFVGVAGAWNKLNTPGGVIVNAVAVDDMNTETVYIGAANEMAIYRSADAGRTWLRVPLGTETIGGVTALAVDGAQRLVYVGTDTAGLFRLRDIGTSMIVGGQLLLDEPILQVAADSTGAGMAFARTRNHLYRAENFGLSWHTVDNLHSVPSALAIANTEPATIYVGTTDRGLLKSTDGLSWTLANEGLGFVPGSRLMVDALAVDPAQPEVLYVATSYLYGSATLHQSPVGVAVSNDGGLAWSSLTSINDVAVVELMPVAGTTGAAYALTALSRTPLALGNVPVVADDVTVVATAPVATTTVSATLAWIVAGLAALALLFAVASDMRRRHTPVVGPLAPNLADSTR